MVPIPQDPHALKLLALDVDEFPGKGFGLRAEFFALDLVLVGDFEFLHELELNRQAMAVPAGDIGRVMPRHRLVADNHVF